MPPPSPSSEAAARAAGWEHFPHGADVGVRGFGLTKAEAFEQAAVALTAVAGLARKVARLIPLVCIKG